MYIAPVVQEISRDSYEIWPRSRDLTPDVSDNIRNYGAGQSTTWFRLAASTCGLALVVMGHSRFVTLL